MALLGPLRRLIKRDRRYPRDINLGWCRRDRQWRAGPARRRAA